MEEVLGDARDACAQAEREVARHPDTYFGYAERSQVRGVQDCGSAVFLCRRSHAQATWADEAWTLRVFKGYR